MDSNSTLAPNYNDNHSESDHCIAYPAVPRSRLRIDPQIEALPKREKEQRPISSGLQEWDLFHDSLFASGAKSGPVNPRAAVGSVTLLSLLLLALIVIPLFQTDMAAEWASNFILGGLIGLTVMYAVRVVAVQVRCAARGFEFRHVSARIAEAREQSTSGQLLRG